MRPGNTIGNLVVQPSHQKYSRFLQDNLMPSDYCVRICWNLYFCILLTDFTTKIPGHYKI